MKGSFFNLNINFSRDSIVLVIVSASVFLCSLFFAPFYYAGDQSVYSNAYQAVFDHGLVDGLLAYQIHISSTEPIHYFVIWIGSNLGVEKNFVMAIFNSILVYLLMRIFLLWNVSIYVGLVVIFTNFYLFVLYLAAERLKFGFIFLMLSLLYSRQRKLSLAFALTSVLAHSQQLVIYASALFSSLMTSLPLLFKKSTYYPRKILLLVSAAVVIIVFFYIMGEHVFAKFQAYNDVAQENSLFSLWKTLVFSLLALKYSSSRLKVLYIFFILLWASALVGPERINMISYCFFMFYALQYKRGINAGVALTSLYFALKTVYFILDIVETGQGFS